MVDHRARSAARWASASFLPIAFALVGCTGTSLTSNAELDALRQTSVNTQQEVREIRALIESQGSGTGASQSDVLIALDELETRFDRLEAQLTDLLDGMARFQQQRVSAPPASMSGSPSEGTPLPLPGSTPGGAPPAISAPPADPRAAYEAAYLEVTRGSYDAAITKFDEFVRNNPSSDLADNAVYWIGESYYAKRDFNRAAEAFTRLIDAYPSGDKVPAAMLKLGFAFHENGDPVAARRYLETLVERFPNSDEASKAQVRLAEL